MKAIVSHSIDITIPFFDVDSIKITWHGNYIKYFEMARCALLDKIGYNYYQMRDSGYGWPVVDVRAKYVAPTLFNQVVCVEAGIVEYENRLKIEYLITDKETGRKCTKGYTTQVAIDLATEKMCFASPKILLDIMEPYL
jgi:acyl-CoA thioester hydrolase